MSDCYVDRKKGVKDKGAFLSRTPPPFVKIFQAKFTQIFNMVQLNIVSITESRPLLEEFFA